MSADRCEARLPDDRHARTRRLATTLALLVAGMLGAGRPAAAAPDETPFVGYLPFPAGKTYRCDQGIKQGPSHDNPANLWAFDFHMTHGEPIAAIADGIVAFVKQDTRGPTGKPQDNNYIGIHHGDGTAATYEHIQKDSARVKEGDRVVAGDVIALVGDTGWAAGPHLHFTCRTGSHRGTSSPCKFREVAGDGMPTTGMEVTSRNFEVRRTAWWRAGRQAVDRIDVCAETSTEGVGAPSVAATRASLEREEHPSAATLVKEMKTFDWPRTRKLNAAKAALAEARKERDLDELARLAAFGAADFADDAELAKACAELAGEFGTDPEWPVAQERLAPLTEFRTLVAAAIAAEDAALAAHVSPPATKDKPTKPGQKPPAKPPAKPPPKAPSKPPAKQPTKPPAPADTAPPAPPADPVLIPGVPDYTAALAAWEKARAAAPGEKEADAIEAHAGRLRDAR